MNKELYMKDLQSIQDMASKIRTLNEAVSFADEYDDPEPPVDGEEGAPANPEGAPNGPEVEMSQGEQPLEKGEVEKQGMAKLQDAGALDQIREITLKGMIKLCHTPEDPEYEALKKIFQMVDKSVNERKEEQQGMK